jgi:phosphoribosylamine-glycine ligase
MVKLQIYQLLKITNALAGDTGLNTGGMGAVSPVPYVDAVLMEK